MTFSRVDGMMSRVRTQPEPLVDFADTANGNGTNGNGSNGNAPAAEVVAATVTATAFC